MTENAKRVILPRVWSYPGNVPVIDPASATMSWSKNGVTQKRIAYVERLGSQRRSTFNARMTNALSFSTHPSARYRLTQTENVAISLPSLLGESRDKS